MSLAFRYLLGVAACLGGGAVAAWVAAPAHRAGALWGVFAGVVLQAPLGWITLRAIGTDRFMLVWGVGMLVRLGAVGVAALILVPVLGPAAPPMLGQHTDEILMAVLGLDADRIAELRAGGAVA